MKLTLNYCTINDVMMVDPKKGDDQKKNRKVILHVDEEDFFDMLDNWTPKKSIAWNVAKEWEDEDNVPVLEEILEEHKKIKKQDNE